MKKLVAIVLITISVLSLSATAEDILFNSVIQMLNQTDDDAAFRREHRHDGTRSGE